MKIKIRLFILNNLIFLRFFAAMLVVVAHGYEGYKGWIRIPKFLASKADPSQLSTVGKFADAFLKNGSYGVEVFFLISGFLTTYLLLCEQNKYSKINLKNFYIRRSLRIWPLYFLVLAFTPFLVYTYNIIHVSWSPLTTHPNYLYYVFFMGNYDVINTTIWQMPVAHFWSIAVEEHFYLVFPLLLTVVNKKHFYSLCGALILVSVVSRIYYFGWYPSTYSVHFDLNTLCRMDTLLVGALFAKMHFDKPFQFKFNKWFLLLSVVLFIFALSIDNWRIMDTLFLVVFKKYVLLLLTTAIAAMLLFSNYTSSTILKHINFNYLGKISFGIYIYHNIFLWFLIQVGLLRLQFGFFTFAAVYFTGTIVVAALSWELFEKKILNYKKRFEIINTAR
jgi:peptidoglycan/LPS O-acetylase OafA/YrhL